MNSINLHKNLLILSFDYRDDIKDYIKTIPGRRFNEKAKTPCWTIPLNTTVVPMVAKLAYEFNFVVSSEAASELQRLYEARERLASLFTVPFAELRLPEIEGLKVPLLPYQRIGVEYLSLVKRAFLCDDMGLNREVTALAAVHKDKLYPCLIVCSNNAWGKWQDEGYRTIPDSNRKQITITSFEFPEEYIQTFKAKEYKSIIVDSCHLLRESNNQRFRAINSFIHKIPNRFFLTSTPMVTGTIDLVPQLSLLDRLDEFGGFTVFTDNYTHVQQITPKFKKYEGVKNEPELWEKIQSICMVSRRKEEVKAQLPEISEKTIEVGLSNQPAYDQALREVKEYMEETNRQLGRYGSSNLAYSTKMAHVLTKLSALREVAAKGKLEGLRDWLLEFMLSGEKIVVFTHSVACALTIKEWVKDRNGIEVILVQNNTTSIVGYTYAVFLDLPFGFERLQQAHDILLDFNYHVNFYYFQAHGTLDDIVWEANHKRELITGREVSGVSLDLIEFLKEKILASD